MQDFYSHSNFVDRGAFTEEEKAEIKKALDDSSYNPRALEKLKMTGWGMEAKDDPEKYHHDEKNKDTKNCPLGGKAYNDAVSAAGKHTYEFLEKLKKELSDEEWNRLIGKKPPCKPSKPPPSVKDREIERLLEDYRGIEIPWPPPLPETLPGPPWKWDCFEISIRYSSNWTTSLTVLEGLPNGVTFLSSNPEPSLLYTATTESPDNPSVTLVLWNFTSLEGGPIGSVEIEYTIRVTEETVTHPSVARRCENPIPGCLILYGEVWEADANGTRYISKIGGQQTVLLEFEPIIEEEQEDAINDILSIYTGQTAPSESHVPYSDVARAIVSVYPQWFKFTLKLADRIPEKPESFTSFTIGVDKDGVAANNCPAMPLDGVDTVYSVFYSLEEESWKIEKSSYVGFWTEANTAAGFQISEERDTLVLWIPRAELGLSQALLWKVVTEVNFVGDRAPNEGTYLTSVSIYMLTVKTLPRTLVKIGGANYTADSAGEVRKYVRAGEFSVEVEPVVSIFDDTRKVFSRWSDGSRSNLRLVNIDRDTTLTAEFYTEYLVTVSSDYGEVSQLTWLREGSTFEISAPMIVSISTGSRAVFNGWTGDLVTSDPSISLTVEWPISLAATWKLQHFLSLSFQDKAGRSITPSWVKLSGLSGILNLTSYEAWVDEGEWRIEKVWYRGVDVCSLPGASYDVSGPLEMDVSTEVYDAKLVLKDAAGNLISNAVVNCEVTFPDGTIQTMDAETGGNGTLIIPSLPKGEHEIKFSYKGQEVEVLVDASTGVIEEVSIPISEAFPIPVSLIIGVLAVLSLAALTYLVLYWTCFITRAGLKKAENEAEEKIKKLSEAEKRLVEARRRREEAKTQLENASRKLKEASRMLEEARKQEESKSWVEAIEEGKRRRITDIDLRLKNKEAQDAWERYRSGEISAEECMREWEKLGEPDALERLREREKKLREEEIQRVEKNVEEGRGEERRAMEELKQAEQQEEKAREDLERLRRKVKEVEEKARRLREELEKCRRKPPPPPPEAPKKLEELVPPPEEKLPEAPPPPELSPPQIPMPPPVYPKPQYLNGRQLKLGMEHESKKLATESLLEPSYSGCPNACWKALQVILAEEWLAILRELGFTIMITPISVAVTPTTTLGTVAKKAIIHLLGLAKVGDLWEYVPEALLSELFGVIFPGWLSDLADTTLGAAGGIKGLEEYLAGQHIQYVEIKQATTLLPSKYTSYKCLCRIDGGIFYNPHTRYVVGVFKCLCGKGPPKLLTIKYRANKDGYSEGLVETTVRDLSPDTPVEAE
ncbi:MAG: hypothetical protein QXT26_03345 [Thermoproteota archaeon]